MRRLVPVIALSAALASAGCGADEQEPRGARSYDAESVLGALAVLPYAEPRGRTQLVVVTGNLDHSAGAFIPPAESVPRAPGGPGQDRLGYAVADILWFAELHDSLDRFAVHTLRDGAAVATDLPQVDGLPATGNRNPGELDPAAATTGFFPIVSVLDQDGDQVAFATEPDRLRDWRAGKGRRLLDRSEELTDVAEALDQEHVRAAHLEAGSFDQFRGHPHEDAIDEDFEAVGIGFSGGEADSRVHVAYWFEDDLPEAAEQVESTWRRGSSRRTYRPLSDVAHVLEVRTDGHVVTVDLAPGPSGHAAVLQLLTSADTPFQGE